MVKQDYYATDKQGNCVNYGFNCFSCSHWHGYFNIGGCDMVTTTTTTTSNGDIDSTINNNCNDCDYKNECDVFRYGDIIDLKFANEIIDNQRKKIRELTKENASLKKEIELNKYIEEKLKRYAIGFKDWESDME